MPSIPEAMRCHLDNPITTLAMCWDLYLCNGVEHNLTSHEEDLYINGKHYLAKTGVSASAISSSSGLAVDNMDIEGILDSEIITEIDILSGAYDHSEIRVFMVNYQNPEDGIVPLRRGWLGEVRLHQGHFLAEIRGLLQSFSTKLGEVYSPKCRATFCDQQCTLNLEQHTFQKLVISQVVDNSTFFFYKDGATLPSNPSLFVGGSIKFDSGNNKGIVRELKYYHNSSVRLMLPMPYAVEIGNELTLHAGCDKNFSTCCKLYNNALNFRGEPAIGNQARMNLRRE